VYLLSSRNRAHRFGGNQYKVSLKIANRLTENCKRITENCKKVSPKITIKYHRKLQAHPAILSSKKLRDHRAVSPCVVWHCLEGQGKQLVLGEVGIEVITDGNCNDDLGSILFDIIDVEEAIALVCQDDVGYGLVFFIQLVTDVLIIPAAGR